MLVNVFSGASIMLVGIVAGWVICNIAHKKANGVSK
jgi:hypothetical protein